MADTDAVLEEHRGHERRTHTRALGPRLRGLVNALVRKSDLLLQQERSVREAAADVDFREFAPGIELLQHTLADHVDGDAAGDFTGAVPAHAVSKHGEPGFAVDKTESSLCVRTIPGCDRLATSRDARPLTARNSMGDGTG